MKILRIERVLGAFNSSSFCLILVSSSIFTTIHSKERTFKALTSSNDLRNKMVDICSSLSMEMKQKNLMGKCLTIKLKLTDFSIKNRSISLHRATNDVETMVDTAVQLLNKELPIKIGVRLMGVR